MIKIGFENDRAMIMMTEIYLQKTANDNFNKIFNQIKADPDWQALHKVTPEKAQLYDHENDPKEFTNLAEKPEMKGTIEQLKQLLHNPP